MTDKLDWVTSGERRKVGTAYSRFVRIMRYVLPLAAIALTVVIILWEDMGATVSKVDQARLMPEVEEARGELLNPRFDSTDTDGRPYTVTAARAAQDANNPKVMNMEMPQARIQMNEAETMEGRAQSGVYEQEAGKLYLRGAVQLDHAAGYTLTSDELRVDLKTGQAFSDLPVHVAGDMGTIDALGLEADNERGLVVFKGPAKLVLVEAGNLSLGGNTP